MENEGLVLLLAWAQLLAIIGVLGWLVAGRPRYCAPGGVRNPTFWPGRNGVARLNTVWRV
jgi:hypothetical protein